jgi:hypothetical protein
MKSSTKQQQWQPARAGLRLLTLATTLGLLALGTSSLSAGGNPNPGIAPINSKTHGKSYSQWAAAWWQWAYSIPVDVNPLLDSTGENAGEGQEGPVWFLAGNFGGETVREVSVPAGKSLFFPILNQPWVQYPEDPPYTIPELRAILRPGMDNATLYCEIDGRRVKQLAAYREESVVFTTTVPDGNLLGLPAGDYAPCVDNGYYLMLTPLKPGKHTIRFMAENADQSFSLDVTYHINVTRRDHDRGDDSCD